MKVAIHKGIRIAVLTRDEHCPPHVHVDGAGWKCTFEFSFWHDSVTLDEVQGNVKTAVLEELRQVVESPQNIRNARVLWWRTMKDICVTNKYWDHDKVEVIDGKLGKANMPTIESAIFDEGSYSTILKLSDDQDPLILKLSDDQGPLEIEP